MKIYIAGNAGLINREKIYFRIYDKRLLSYWEIHKELFQSHKTFKLILDHNEGLLRRSTRRG
jgi:hypothetical protein